MRVFAIVGLLFLVGACDLAQGLSDDRGAGDVVEDNIIRAKLNTAFLQESGDLFLDVSSSVFQGRVMLTGSVDNQSAFDQAGRIANAVGGVLEVTNELQVIADGGFKATTSDLTIETKLKTKLVGDSAVKSVNYRWKSVNGIVYLLGVAQNQAELNRVLQNIRDTAGVKRVVQHVRLKA